jgi:fucose 4-O-acetylase-like acetyltransferase
MDHHNQVMASQKHWINWMKTICFFFIFLSHSEFYLGYGNTLPYYEPFYTNAFFFISGYLLLGKQLTEEKVQMDSYTWWHTTKGGKYVLMNCIWKILIPSILFCAIFFFPKNLLRGNPFVLKDFVLDTILGRASWFTWALFIAEMVILSVLFFRRKSVWTFLLVSVMMVILVSVIDFYNISFMGDREMPFNYRRGLLASAYLSLGGVYMQYEAFIDRLFAKRVGMFVMLSFAVLYLLVVSLAQRLSELHSLLSLYKLNYLLGAISIIVLIYFCKRLKGSQISDYIGRNSIGFFFFCGAFPNIFAVIANHLGASYRLLFMPFIITIISYFVVYWLVLFLNKYMPYLFDLRIIWNKNKK